MKGTNPLKHRIKELNMTKSMFPRFENNCPAIQKSEVIGSSRPTYDENVFDS